MSILKSIDYQTVLFSSALFGYKETYHLVKNKDIAFSPLSDWVKIIRKSGNSQNWYRYKEIETRSE